MKKSIVYLMIFLVVFGIGGYFLYINFFAEETTPSLGVVKVLETSFETKIFDSANFLKLKQHITLPIETNIKGKINPFMKF